MLRWRRSPTSPVPGRPFECCCYRRHKRNCPYQIMHATASTRRRHIATLDFAQGSGRILNTPATVGQCHWWEAALRCYSCYTLRVRSSLHCTVCNRYSHASGIGGTVRYHSHLQEYCPALRWRPCQRNCCDTALLLRCSRVPHCQTFLHQSQTSFHSLHRSRSLQCYCLHHNCALLWPWTRPTDPDCFPAGNPPKEISSPSRSTDAVHWSMSQRCHCHTSS